MSAPAPPGLVTVELRGIPLALHARATEHSQDLQREFVLIAEALQHDDGPSGLPRRLLALVETMTHRYGGFTAAQEDALDTALHDGRATLDLTFRAPPDAAEAAVALTAVLDEADGYCREGRHLLTLATPPELVRYRHWYLRQFVDQIAGLPPSPWRAGADGSSP